MRCRLCFALAVVAFVAGAADFPKQVKWKTSVEDGYLDDVANWTNAEALPAEGDTQTIDMNGVTHDVTVRVGPGTNLVQKAHFYVVNIPNGRKVTIDTTGGHYVQAAANYFSNWQGFGFYGNGTSHWCNFEGLNTTGGAPICSLDDAVLEASVDGSGKRTIELKQGTWNCYDPIPGGTLAANTFMFGNSGDNNTAIFGEGGFFKANGLTMRGGTIKFTGGNHEIRGGVYIGNAYAYNPRLEVSGGTLGLTNNVMVGNQSEKSATLDVNGTGRLLSRAQLQIGVKADKQEPAVVNFSGDSVSELKTVYIGYSAGVTNVSMNLSDNARVTMNDALTVANAARSVATLDVAGHATLETKVINTTANSDACAKFNLRENAVWKPTVSALVGVTRSGSSAELTMKDAAQIESGKEGVNLQAGSNGRIEIGGDARIEAPNMWLEAASGTNGILEITGGNTRLRGFHAYGNKDAPNVSTNVIRVSGGTHTTVMDTSGSYVALTVGYISSQSLFEMTGGKLYMPRLVRVGYSTTGTGSATMRMLGGDLELTPDGNQTPVLNVCDSVESNGRLELLGGVIRAGSVRGWTGATNKGGKGWAALYADGGTIASIPLTTKFVETFDEALLGERGLTLDTTMHDASVNQAFTDAASDVTGRVFKVGGGTLTVEKNSAHGETVVAYGTLAPASASVTQFGRSLVVTNGATVSLTGAPTSLTVERLALGDERTRGVLTLDQGDVVTITGTDGLKVGRGFVRCDAVAATPGTQTFFRLSDGATVDPAELANLHVLNGSAEYQYVFEIDGNEIKLKVEAWKTTPTTWTGAKSGDWADDGNWDPSGPDSSTVANFPTTAAVKSVTVPANAEVQAMVVEDDYAFAGEGPIQLIRVKTAEGKKATFATGVSPVSSFILDADEESEIALGAGLDSQSGSLFAIKSGSGLLSLGAPSLQWDGEWTFSGGTTRAAAAAALGPQDNPSVTLTFGAGTLAFAEQEQEYARSFVMDAGAGRATVIDAQTNAVLRGNVSATTGAFVKRGAGCLTFVAPKGGNSLSADHMDGGVNKDPDADIALPPSGDGPGTTGLGGFNVLEGTVRLDGVGAGETVYSQTHFLQIGARYEAAANAELEVANCTLQQGGSGIHLLVGGTTPPTTAATAPTLRVVENGIVKCDTLRIGNKGHSNGGRLPVFPTLAVTNGTVEASFTVKVGDTGDSLVQPHVYLGANAQLVAKGTSASAGIEMGNNSYLEVADGGLLKGNGVSTRGLYLTYKTCGEAHVLRGGRIAVPYISSDPNYADTSKQFNFFFNGGELEFTAGNGCSIVSLPLNRVLTLEEEGLAMIVDAGKRHTFTLPVRGTGAFAKRGAGECVFVPGREYRGNVTNELGFVTAGWSGLSTVEEGTLTLVAGAATNTLAVKVMDGAVLQVDGAQTIGALSGAGTVRGAGTTPVALDCRVSVPWNEPEADVPTFENVSLSRMKIDFNVPEDMTYPEGMTLPVARLGANVTTDISTWRSVRAGRHHVAKFTQTGDLVSAEIRLTGCTLIVR